VTFGKLKGVGSRPKKRVPSVIPTLGTRCNTHDPGVRTPNREHPGLPKDDSPDPLRPIGAEKIGVKFSTSRPNSREVAPPSDKVRISEKAARRAVSMVQIV